MFFPAMLINITAAIINKPKFVYKASVSPLTNLLIKISD